jgi:hypothetical protein
MLATRTPLQDGFTVIKKAIDKVGDAAAVPRCTVQYFGHAWLLHRSMQRRVRAMNLTLEAAKRLRQRIDEVALVLGEFVLEVPAHAQQHDVQSKSQPLDCQ